MAIVNVRNLVRYYGGLRALDEVGFSVDKGEIVGVLGLNGAGKTTCLRILAGLLTPTAGKVDIGGRDVLDDPIGVRSLVGFLPEEPPLYREMTVDAYLRHTGRLKGMTRAEVEARLPEACERTGLDDVTRRRIIGELSHGYRKRVGIAQAILHNPPLVILDEPISGLDPAQIVEMRKTIGALRREHSVMVSSHILTEISQTCDRILVFHEGRLIAEGTEEALAGKAGRCLELTVRGSSERVDAVLAGHDAVTEHSSFISDEGFVTVSVRLSEDVGELDGSPEQADDGREGLIAALVAAGLGIRRVVESDGELESVFLGITGAKSASVPESEEGESLGEPKEALPRRETDVREAN